MGEGVLFLEGFDIGNVRVPLLRIVIIVSAFLPRSSGCSSTGRDRQGDEGDLVRP